MVNKEFEAFKLSIVKAMDFSASKDEIKKIKQIILDYNNNPLVDEKNKCLIPPFIAIDGLGDTVAKNIESERQKGEFISIEDLQKRAKI